MKLSTFVIAATIAAASSNLKAADFLLKPIDQNLETQTCYVAAKDGLDAAETLLAENNLSFKEYTQSLSCNGLNIRKFAALYNQKNAVKTPVSKRIAVVAKNTDAASQLCLDALVIGEDAARAKHDIYGNVVCNREDLGDFVASFADKEVEVRISED